MGIHPELLVLEAKKLEAPPLSSVALEPSDGLSVRRLRATRRDRQLLTLAEKTGRMEDNYPFTGEACFVRRRGKGRRGQGDEYICF